MDFLETAKTRYATKIYDKHKKISQEDIEKLIKILQLSPSSINSQPWHFTIVSDSKVKQELANASYFNMTKIEEASHLVVFSSLHNVQKFENEFLVNFPESPRFYYNEFIKKRPKEEINNWFKNQVYLSLGFFLAACAEMKIDSTPMEGIEVNKYDEILQHADYKTAFAVAIGYRSPEDKNQPSIRPKLRLPIEKTVRLI